MPAVNLLPGERMTRSGHLFERAPLFVRRTAWVLRDNPKLFDDIQIQSDRLVAQQDRAEAWLKLHLLFKDLAQRAADCYLLDQTEAQNGAMTVINQVRADDKRPYPHPLQRERRLAMEMPEQVLADRFAQKQKRAALNKKKKADEARKSEAGQQATKRTAPHQKEMEQYQRQQTKRFIDKKAQELFRSCAEGDAGAPAGEVESEK